MTNTPDTSPEAVERYEARQRLDRALNTPSSALREIREWKDRAEDAEADLMGAQGQIADAQSYLAERDALKAELAEAVEFVEDLLSGRDRDDDWRVDARAIIARHQKGADT